MNVDLISSFADKGCVEAWVFKGRTHHLEGVLLTPLRVKQNPDIDSWLPAEQRCDCVRGRFVWGVNAHTKIWSKSKYLYGIRPELSCGEAI